MRKLSQISGEEGMVALGRIMPIIPQMIRKAGAMNGMNRFEYFGKMLENAPDLAIQVIAIIDGGSVEEYRKKNVIEIMKDVNVMVDDDELINLFESQMKTKT